MENVVIKEVNNKGNGWFEISLDGDDRVLSTKKEKLAEIANASAGSSVEVEINTREKGRFTDHYLESINGEKGDSNGAAKPRATRSVPTKSVPASTGGKSDAVQERIARQWAFGRATELLMASENEFSFPLDVATMRDLERQAEALLEMTKDK